MLNKKPKTAFDEPGYVPDKNILKIKISSQSWMRMYLRERFAIVLPIMLKKENNKKMNSSNRAISNIDIIKYHVERSIL